MKLIISSKSILFSLLQITKNKVQYYKIYSILNKSKIKLKTLKLIKLKVE